MPSTKAERESERARAEAFTMSIALKLATLAIERSQITQPVSDVKKEQRDPILERLGGKQMTSYNKGHITQPITNLLNSVRNKPADEPIHRAPERVIKALGEIVEETTDKKPDKTRLESLYEEAIMQVRKKAAESSARAPTPPKPATPAPKPAAERPSTPAPPKPAPPAAKPAAERPSTPAPPAPKPAAPAAPAVSKPAAPKTAAPKPAAPAVSKPVAPKTAAPKTAAPKPAAPAAPKPAAPKPAAARKSATSRSKSIPAGRPSTPPAPMPPKPKSPTKPRPTKAERDAKAGAAALAGAHAAIALGRITRHRSATPPKTRTVKSPARPAIKPSEVYAVREGGKLHETVQKYLKRADGTYRKLGERQSINDFKGRTHLLNHGDPATWAKPFPTDKVV